jgi:RNA polymerase-binding transcription factor DksA
LSEQRVFRINQLIQLEVARPEAAADAVATEVHEKLRAGALAVVSEIDSALRRIRRGTYGRCQRCGDPMSHMRLAAMPSASTCGSCQRLEQMDGSEPRRTPGPSGKSPSLRDTNLA